MSIDEIMMVAQMLEVRMLEWTFQAEFFIV